MRQIHPLDPIKHFTAWRAGKELRVICAWLFSSVPAIPTSFELTYPVRFLCVSFFLLLLYFWNLKCLLRLGSFYFHFQVMEHVLAPSDVSFYNSVSSGFPIKGWRFASTIGSVRKWCFFFSLFRERVTGERPPAILHLFIFQPRLGPFFFFFWCLNFAILVSTEHRRNAFTLLLAS